ncbi:MAG: carbamoyl phosphate synthase small subunit [Oscillospiraceae bacterium]|nr:carbamoyl phosphate synthase small subunit [Oscillospiraceae bacterium]
MKATLILSNGAVFRGDAIGAMGERVCEMVFNTSMTGYQEILTDPSYAGQGVVMSYPLMGNYGVNGEDNESLRPWAEALVVRRLSPVGSNFRCEGSLGDYLRQHDIVGIQGVDTRALTKLLRSQGTMNGMITCAEHFHVQEVMDKLAQYRVSGTVERVTRKEAQVYAPTTESLDRRVAMMDYGVKQNMIECLRKRGCEVTVFPAHTPAAEILGGGFDGVMLSNGPGDPADNVDIIKKVRALYDSGIPLFAVCLGHQLLALATGARTHKMTFGHRGGNHPVKDLEAGRCFITSQNHGYVVDGDSVDPSIAQVSHVNVNDGTVEGLKYRRPNCFTVQFHPEASPGPEDTEYLFDRFIASMGGGRNA